ncbi:hypothetical protein ACW4TU_32415 [Streptomyces sp. QTS52]
MSQQHPQQPGWGTPQQGPGWGAPPPPPEKKSSFGKILGFGCLGIVALLVIVGVFGAALGGGSSSDNSSKDKAVSAEAGKPAKESVAQKSQAAQFKDCVAKSGTATEKTAVKHVTKVTGVDKSNDILDAAEVFTDYSGGLLGTHGSDGKLIASAFASCYESKNGLVTVYDKDGEILSNGNY